MSDPRETDLLDDEPLFDDVDGDLLLDEEDEGWDDDED